MNTSRRHAVAALIAAGLLWGTTVPLSKLALQWLSPGWLTEVRFSLAAAVLLAASRRRGLRRAFTPAVLAAGALGYGGSVMLQNAGISRTSVTHAALMIGAVPVLVAIIAAVWHRTVARLVAWFGFALSLGGVGLVTAGGGGGGATLAGGGTLLPFTLFAFGQSRVSAEVAGAFLNLEPLVGAIAGVVAFRDPVGLAQVAGGVAIVAGIGLSSLPLLSPRPSGWGHFSWLTAVGSVTCRLEAEAAAGVPPWPVRERNGPHQPFRRP